jgi:hypothetical protein
VTKAVQRPLVPLSALVQAEEGRFFGHGFI